MLSQDESAHRCLERMCPVSDKTPIDTRSVKLLISQEFTELF